MEYELSNLRSHRIKFRAYDDVLCRMMKPLTLEEIFKGSFGSCNLYQLTIMEYTGFKDAKGTEIYEGDIIKNTTANYVYVVVSICQIKPMLNIKGLEVDERLAAKGAKRFMPQYPKQTFEEFNEFDVVIGNVYENSELIGGRSWEN